MKILLILDKTVKEQKLKKQLKEIREQIKLVQEKIKVIKNKRPRPPKVTTTTEVS